MTEPIPPAAYLLADHLDAALAAGEDLLGAAFACCAPPTAAAADLAQIRAAQRRAVERIRALELVLLARILKGRERACELARADARVASVARLFVAGTAVLLDAVAECGDSTDLDFESADTLSAYLRGRGLLAADAAAPAAYTGITLDERFLVARRLQLGAVLDLAATFLDTLELHYELYAAADTDRGLDEELEQDASPTEPDHHETLTARLAAAARASRAA